MIKKILITFTLLFSYVSLFSQIDYKKEAEKDLKKQDSILKVSYSEFKKSKDSLSVLTDNLSPKLSEYYKKVVTFKKHTDSLYKIAETSLSFYALKGVKKSVLDSLIRLPKNYVVGFKEKQGSHIKETKQEQDNLETTTYLYFGNKKVIPKDRIIKDTIANDILTSTFLEDSETHFGNFWFPRNNQRIPVFNKNCIEKLDEIGCDDIKYLKFLKLDIDLYEGTLRDLKVYLKDDNENIYLFENSVGISLIRFNKLSGINFLHNSSNQTGSDKGKSEYINYQLRVSDVLRYFSRPNGNYVPNDETFTFPIENLDGKTNENSSNIYELRQSTSLNNVIDLRAYTDILGLINQNDNGITNFSGQADFFLVPFRLGTRKFNVFLLKKIKPYISYSRFDDEDKFLALADGSNQGYKTLENRLDHIRKSYLETGVRLFLLNFKLSKDLPFETGLYSSARYQLSKVNLPSGAQNYKALGLGGGINFEIRKLENLSLSYSLEFSEYNQDSYNDIKGFEDSNNFLVMRNEAEFSYHPDGKKDSAIFLKLVTFDDMEKGVDSNIFQLQFGYKFTFGVGNIKTK